MKATIQKPLPTKSPLQIKTLDPNDVSSRLEELTRIRDGWLDGKGIAPNASGLHWLASVWDNSFPNDLPSPFIYPTPDGGVQLEWTIGPWELAAEIDLLTRRATLIAQKSGSDESFDGEADLNIPGGWEKLARFVRNRRSAGNRKS